MISDIVAPYLPLEIVIFSKDRACQLEALLRSMEQYFMLEHRVSVLYFASTSEYDQGYRLVIEEYSAPEFYREMTFKKNLLRIFDAGARKNHRMFLVDDIVFIRDYAGGENLELFTLDESILTISLRLGENITYCQPRGIDTVPHDFSRSNGWRWQEGHTGYWNYPMSLDGHIFRAKDLNPLLNQLEFNNPNRLEAALAKRPPIKRPWMLAEREPYLVNLALNRVQTIFPNPHGEVSIKQLNDAFLDGERLDLEPIISAEYNSCHASPPIRFESGKALLFD